VSGTPEAYVGSSGHQTDKKVTRYTKAADQIELADRAMKAIGGS